MGIFFTRKPFKKASTEKSRPLPIFTACTKKKPRSFDRGFVFALPIFTASHPATIVGVHELNFCVRDGNRWTLMTINTNSMDGFNHLLLKHGLPWFKLGDPYRIRTDVNGVRGRCLNHLTNGPFGAPSGTRTRDPMIKSQLLYQLS